MLSVRLGFHQHSIENPQTSGSRLFRAVLAADNTGLLATSRLLAEVGSGRYRATSAEGMYL